MAWSTDEYVVQRDNGVLNLLTSLANYAGYVQFPEIKKQNWYNLWSRPTIGWNLTCEVNGFSREKGMEILSTPLRSIGNASFLQLYGGLLIALIFVPLTGLCMPNKSGLICMEIIYTLTRILSAVACYHMVILLEQERSMIHSNLEVLQGFKLTNPCLDESSQLNVPMITNDLDNAIGTLEVLHYTIWACAIFTVLEFLWMIPCGEFVRQTRKRANKNAKNAAKHGKFENEASNTME